MSRLGNHDQAITEDQTIHFNHCTGAKRYRILYQWPANVLKYLCRLPEVFAMCTRNVRPHADAIKISEWAKSLIDQTQRNRAQSALDPTL